MKAKKFDQQFDDGATSQFCFELVQSKALVAREKAGHGVPTQPPPKA